MEQLPAHARAFLLAIGQQRACRLARFAFQPERLGRIQRCGQGIQVTLEADEVEHRLSSNWRDLSEPVMSTCEPFLMYLVATSASRPQKSIVCYSVPPCVPAAVPRHLASGRWSPAIASPARCRRCQCAWVPVLRSRSVRCGSWSWSFLLLLLPRIRAPDWLGQELPRHSARESLTRRSGKQAADMDAYCQKEFRRSTLASLSR